MASLCRLTTGALLGTGPRRVGSGSFCRLALLSSTALSVELSGSSNAPEVFDIFDAPVKLRKRTILSTALVTSRGDHSHAKDIYNDALGLPWSLPPPVTFDGPACPPHVSPLMLQKRRLQRQNLIPSPTRDQGSSALSCSVFTSQSEPLYQLFDKPSCIALAKMQKKRYSFTYVSLALCFSTGFGWFVLEDSLAHDQVGST